MPPTVSPGPLEANGCWPSMVRPGTVLLSGMLGTLVAFQTPVQAQQADSAEARLPVSMERIRTALERQERQQRFLRGVDASNAMPMFHDHVEVRGRLHVLTPVQEDAFDPTLGLPSVSELAMGGIEKVRSAVVKYMRSRAERRARREVKDALAAFCAARACPPHFKAYIRAQQAEDEQGRF
jgi:hypothetical protein